MEVGREAMTTVVSDNDIFYTNDIFLEMANLTIVGVDKP